MGALMQLAAAPVNWTRDAARVVRGPLPPRLKTGVLKTYASLATRAAFTDRRFTGRVLNYRVSAFSTSAIAFLFREIFVDLDYYFDTAARAPFIIDCGSNVGMAVLFFKSLYPESRIIAFEPGADSFSLLQRNVAENALGGVELHDLAVGNTECVIDFFRSSRPGSFTSSVSIERTGGVKTSVRQVRLSTFIDADVDLLKLDVEGGEWGVLTDLIDSGCIGRIAQMVIEYHHHMSERDDRFGEFLLQLQNHGFGYQLRAEEPPRCKRGQFQDILVYAYRQGGRPQAVSQT